MLFVTLLTTLGLLAFATLAAAGPLQVARAVPEPSGSIVPIATNTPPEPGASDSAADTAATSKFQWQVWKKCTMQVRSKNLNDQSLGEHSNTWSS